MEKEKLSKFFNSGELEHSSKIKWNEKKILVNYFQKDKDPMIQ